MARRLPSTTTWSDSPQLAGTMIVTHAATPHTVSVTSRWDGTADRRSTCTVAQTAVTVQNRRGAAALAELPAAAVLPAGRAGTGRLITVVDVLGPVLILDLLIKLADLRRRLHARDFLVELGRAAHAEPALRVPADLAAHPLPAPVALMEIRLHLIDGLGERLVAG
jgi:hypothetical protein